MTDPNSNLPDAPGPPDRVSSRDIVRASAREPKWWDHEDFPYSAPWWLRYPVSVVVFYVSYWAFFEWEKRAGWILGLLLLIIGVGLARELLFGFIAAALVGGILWALGAVVAVLPVSLAIIIGAVIIAQALRR